jgi:hypothetical protein
MTTSQAIAIAQSTAQDIIANYIKDWCENIAPDFIEDSIRGGVDDEVIAALDLVGFDFDWGITVTRS